MTSKLRLASAVFGLVAFAGCKTLDVVDLNNPGLEGLESSPTRVGVNTAAVGLLVGLRTGVAEPNGYIVLLGIMGREGYNLNTSSDPRYVSEMVLGPLSGGSPAFGANIWPARYANIRNSVILLNAVGNTPGLSDAEKEGIRGFAKTIQAMDLLTIIITRDANGAVIDVDRPPTGAPGDIASKTATYARIVALLEEARTHLLAAGSAFSFSLGAGFAGFDTPATFLKVNRAIRARVAVYLNDWSTALTALQASFLDRNASLGLGAYHTYGTGSGDLTNNIPATDPFIRALPTLVSSAQLRGNGQPDLRASSKVSAGTSASGAGLSSNQIFNVYPTNTSMVPIIRNEELILLRAEANLGLNNIPQALDDINFIRTTSGGLAAYAGAATAGAVLDELLYNKRYSLLWEGGHSWIDARHYNKLAVLPRGLPGGHFFTKMPFPDNECLARTPPPAATAGCGPEVGQ